MKSECIKKSDIISNLDELLFLSKFILYDSFGFNKKELRKSIKKLKSQVEKDQINKYIKEEYLEIVEDIITE